MKKIVFILIAVFGLNSCALFFPGGVWSDLSPVEDNDTYTYQLVLENYTWADYPIVNNKIAIGYDISNTIDIYSLELIPFLIGDIVDYFLGTEPWNATGLLPNGTGPQVLRSTLDGILFAEFNILDSSLHQSWFKIANYHISHYEELLADVWSFAGYQSSVDAQWMSISNFVILKVRNPQTFTTNASGETDNGLIVEDRKVLITLISNGGWSAGQTP